MVFYKYNEDKIISRFQEYIDETYKQHYKATDRVECFDCWLAMDDASPTFRNTAIKYLWRVGKKGTRKDSLIDVLKAMHYCQMLYYSLEQEEKQKE